jgi:plasmid stabilization system protein ParE
MVDVEFHRLAAKEYRAAQNWYRARSDEAAARFRDAVDRAVDRITNTPDVFAHLEADLRWIRVGRFPYTLIFRRPAQGSISVVAVAHTSRRPGYWRRRR